MRILVDGAGGDHAPAAVIEGARQAMLEYGGQFPGGLRVGVVGTEAMRADVESAGGLEHVAAAQVIGMDEHPARAARAKRDSTMHVAAQACREGAADAWVSAGNSGAVLAVALLVQGRLRGVERPALGTVLPTARGRAYLIDAGANVDCRSTWLAQFAQMGTVYSKRLLGVECPRVGLLSNGEEEEKGNMLVQQAHRLLRELPGLDFAGNVEPKEVLRGGVDVVVADGFCGNLVIKTAEATAELLFGLMRQEIPTTWGGRLGGLLIRPRVAALRGRLDWREYGGAPLLGIDGVAVVAHGRSDAVAVKNAIRVAAEAVHNRLVDHIRVVIPAPPAGAGARPPADQSERVPE